MMALFGGVTPAAALAAGPGPGGYYTGFPPIDRLSFGRREKDVHEPYYHVVQKHHPLQDKLNQIKHLLQEKFHKKHNRGGHYEHSGHDKPKDQSAAISALTLLAFLFFLYILQSCIRDHMNQMAQTTTTTAATVIAFRENRQSSNFQKSDRKGESEEYYYEEYPEEIPAKLPVETEVRRRSSSALQVYQKPGEKYDNYRHMEPVKLIVKP